jgi:thiol:disulfide interchange protein DsbD
MTRPALAVAAVLLTVTAAPAQPPDFGGPVGNPFGGPGGRPKSFDDIASISAEVVPAKAKRGQTVTYKLTVTPNPGAWTYPTKPQFPDQPGKNAFVLPTDGPLVFPAPAADPPGAKVKPGQPPAEYYPGPVTWEFPAVVSPAATPGKKAVELDPRSLIQACNDQTCLNARDLPAAELVVTDDPPVPVEEQYRAAVDRAQAAAGRGVPPPAAAAPAPAPKPAAGSARKVAKSAEDYQTELDDVLGRLDRSGAVDAGGEKDDGLGAFVATAALWGLISLVTPCVFPMIPITVSIFLKQAHGSLRERLKLAGVYCLTIIVVLGVSAFTLLKFMALLSVHPVTNVLLGGLFVVLALSLFGMYELTLPNSFARRFQAGQAKGGVVGTFFGALAFTVISFTCVAPFLGGFAGIASAGGGGGFGLREVAGGVAFATAFAAPFFVLALVPGLLKALPRSGGWLDSVKVVMGFLELAAALKFFRTAELGVFSPPRYFTYDLVMAGWVAIAGGCGLYLLNLYRLPHDEERPNIGVPRLFFALLFLGLGVYLLPAIFKGPDGRQRPAGAVYAWVDAFLLPEPGRRSEMAWGTDLADALKKAREARLQGGKPVPVFVDFTGVTCTNCSYNEESVFPLPAVKEELERFERVRLYTDWVPADAFTADPGDRARRAEGRANGDFQVRAFGTAQLPLYAVLLPQVSGTKVKVLGVYDEGKINDPDRFAAFLKEALAAAGK